MATRAPQKGRLGRGLGSLIPTTPEKATPAPEPGAAFPCPIDRIEALPDQPRTTFDETGLQELATSIRHNGIIQPLIVRAVEGGGFRLIAGERRLRAARLAGLDTVPVVIREEPEEDDFALALIENIQRRDLDALEEARAYQRLISEHAFTQDELAQRVGKSRPAITNALRLLRLGAPIQQMITEGKLSAGHARAIASVPPEHQGRVAERVMTKNLSVRDAEEYAKALKEGPARRAARPAPAPLPAEPEPFDGRPEVEQVMRELQSRFGLKVELFEKDDTSGAITFFFANRDALNDFLDRLRTAQ